MNRRDFMTATGAGMGAAWPGFRMLAASVKGMAGKAGTAIDDHTQTASEPSHLADCMYHVLGVPLRAGSLYPGNENDAQPYRDAQLVARLRAAGCKAVDDGDVTIPSYLPHHSIPPIRSWPAPRIAWECVRDRVAPLLQQPNQIPLLIGCDCSVVIGTAEALMRASAQDIHVLYVDGDFDDAAPESGRSQSAASCAVWLLTHPSPSGQSGTGSLSLADVRRTGPQETARQAMQAIPASASLLLHFDIDVLQ